MQVHAPNRVEHSYTQHLCAAPADVFPMLCPVREVEWVNGWAPSLVLTESGGAEEGCVFVTPGVPRDAVWVMTRYDPENFCLAMIKLIPDLVVGQFHIELRADNGGDGTVADITYGYTSLGRHGDEVVAGFTQEHFAAFMTTWESELNHFLRTGKIQNGEKTAGDES